MNEEPWHLSKTIPLSLIFAIAVQTVVVIWFIAELSSDVEHNKSSIIKLEDRTDSLYIAVQQQAIASARMEENLKAIRNAVELMAGISNRRADNETIAIP